MRNPTLSECNSRYLNSVFEHSNPRSPCWGLTHHQGIVPMQIHPIRFGNGRPLQFRCLSSMENDRVDVYFGGLGAQALERRHPRGTGCPATPVPSATCRSQDQRWWHPTLPEIDCKDILRLHQLYQSAAGAF
jgi:hypothetical protein